MAKIKVLVVDDSALIRQLFTEMIQSQSDMEVIATAIDPHDAREKIKLYNPDVLTLDIEMPKMDGLSFLEKLMTLRPMPVIMASTLTLKGAETTIRALEFGAIDYISKPTNRIADGVLTALREELCQKIRIAARATVRGRSAARGNARMPVLRSFYHASSPIPEQMIAIGASTGGVEALHALLTQLPANMPPILITQHMPEKFTSSFAKRLDNMCTLNVVEAEHKMPISAGYAYIAPGGKHLKLVKRGNLFSCELDESAPVSSHRPSVDVMFTSVAEAMGAHALGILLTGMGKDGAKGLLRMRQSGAATIGQMESSCVVYGMPRAAHELGAVEVELSLDAIAQRMCHFEIASQKAHG